MAALRTELVRKRHAYTGEDVPWDVDGVRGSSLWRCIRGGLPIVGTSARAAVIRRQERFLRFAVLVAAVWLLFFFL